MNPLIDQVRDLLAWADYIVDSLHPGAQQLRETLGDSALRDLRIRAWELREHLNRARILSEVRCTESDAPRALHGCKD